jgi:hypothetical protein
MLKPITAYITYQDPLAVNLLMRLNTLEKWDGTIGEDETLNIRSAPNPMDILHQNFKRREELKEKFYNLLRKLSIITIIIVILCLIFIVKIIFLSWTYPLKKLNCAQTYN